MFFVLISAKYGKNKRVQHTFNFLKLIKFTVLFYFVSSDQSEMVDWLKSKSLTRCQVYPRLKTVTKTFLEKVALSNLFL